MQLKSVLLDLDGTKNDKISVFDVSQQSIKREGNIKCMHDD